ncbi:MAG TPA: hypothetical protein PLB62_00245 [Candidatus Sumerlaeota bacterium]|nr:hypothetical protein [Candidatus Sumerlaeota bacterium]
MLSILIGEGAHARNPESAMAEKSRAITHSMITGTLLFASVILSGMEAEG